MVGKLNASGVAAWAHQYGGSADDAGAYVHMAPNGSILVYGTSSGQLPQQPAAAARGVFALSYASDGTRGWLHQFDSGRPYLLSVDAAANGNSYGINGQEYNRGAVFSLGADGSQAWSNRGGADLERLSKGSQSSHIAAAADGDGFYTFHGYYPSCVLARWNRDSSLLWSRASAVRNVVIDPIENVIWHGSMEQCEAILVTGDTIYLAGSFTNTYENGSTYRPSTRPLFVASYDLNGNQKWFKLLYYGIADAGALHLTMGSKGRPVLATSTGLESFVLRFDPASGALL